MLTAHSGASLAGVEPAPHPAGGGVDVENRRWLAALRGEGAGRDDAVVRLHALLLRAARFEVARRRQVMPHIRGGDADDVANQAADDALVSLLARLDDFRGESRFTTWAYKFALLEAAVALRRRAWQGREIPLRQAANLELFPALAPTPQEAVEQRELIDALGAAIAEVLTSHQRAVFSALALNGVPIDVLADRLGTTRGALYKTLHDARRKLRGELARRGFTVSDTRSGR